MPNNNYNPKIHHRRSIRLKNYDYASDGTYFATICTQHKEYMFGNVIDGKMVLNSAGKMIKKWLCELENKFKNIKLNEYIIMPNHIHLIIFIMVGANLCVCPIGIQRIIQWLKTMTTNEYIRNVKQNDWKRFDRKLWQKNYYDRIIRNEKELDKIRKYILENPLKWELDKNNLENLFM
ncbi:MAG: transposase [Patescibacteria group bacterium]|nr:transposase [Patescibacteria group bacterium]